jgi:hypothetical protein
MGSRRAVSRTPGSAQALPQSYIDTLPAEMLRLDPGAEVTYAVEVLNRNARGAGLSNRVHVPAIVTLPAPDDLSAELTGDGVVLRWTSAGELQNVQAHTGSNAATVQFRYRIYRYQIDRDQINRDQIDRNQIDRGAESAGKYAVAGEVPVGKRGPVQFIDSGFEWEKTYLYRVTAVSIIQRADSEVQVEGEDTAPVRVVAHDVFPPAVPTGLQAAYSGEGQKLYIDLIWAPVTSADLAGYNVYRAEEDGSAAATMVKVGMVKINAELVKLPAYRDSAVTSGKTYTYSVSAVDVRGNESGRSEETRESVP